MPLPAFATLIAIASYVGCVALRVARTDDRVMDLWHIAKKRMGNHRFFFTTTMFRWYVLSASMLIAFAAFCWHEAINDNLAAMTFFGLSVAALTLLVVTLIYIAGVAGYHVSETWRWVRSTPSPLTVE